MEINVVTRRCVGLGVRLWALILYVCLVSASISHAQSKATYIDLHDFGAGSDGFAPSSSVTFDKAGNMYGTCQYGGAWGLGNVWEITVAGNYLDLHDFGSPDYDNGYVEDGFVPNAGVSFDAAGNMYGTCELGGYWGGIVWEITPSGAYLIVHDFGGTVTNADGTSGSDGYYPLSKVAIDPAGNLFGATNEGGPNGYMTNGENGYESDGMVWEITAAGTYRDLHDFGGTGDSMNPGGDLTFDNVGNLYGVTELGVVWEITSLGAYQIVNASSGPNGILQAGVTFDKAGNMYGTTCFDGTHGQGTVWEITAAGRFLLLHDFGGIVMNAYGSYGLDGQQPCGEIAIDQFGNLYGTASLGGRYSVGVPDFRYDTGSSTCGMVWEITASGLYLDLHDFGGRVVDAIGVRGPDCYEPFAGITLDNAGNVYGTGYNGGPYDQPSSGSYSYGYTLAYNGGSVWSIGPILKGFDVSPTSIQGGSSTTGIVTLSHAAPVGGETFALKSSDLSASVPESVTVEAGATSRTFPITTSGVNFKTDTKITATSTAGSRSAMLTITPATLSSVTLSTTELLGGLDAAGTATLSGPAGPLGVNVRLASDSQSAFVPRYVTVKPGKTSVNFAVKTGDVSVQRTATISGNVNGKLQFAKLTINPATF